MTNRERLILNAINSQDSINSDNLSFILNVSVRTIKNDIKSLKEKLNLENEILVSKSGFGYYINPKFKDIVNDLIDNHKKDLNNYNHLKLENKENRMKYLFYLLLIKNKRLFLDDLRDTLFLSETMIRRDILSFEEFLQSYNLTLQINQRNRLKIVGKEIDIRDLIFDIFDSESIENELGFKPNIDNHLYKLVSKADLVYSNYSLEAISKFTLIMLFREKNGFEYNGSIDINNRKIEYICNEFIKILNINGKNYYSYLYVQFLGRQIHESDQSMKLINSFDDILDLMVNEIQITFDIDIKYDLRIFNLLRLHLGGMILRIQLGLSSKNKIEYQLLRRYLLAVKITISAVEIIERVYKISVGLDEFILLIYYFNVIIQKQKSLNKKIIGLFSLQGRAEDLMYFNILKESFYPPKYDVIAVTDSKLLNDSDVIVSNAKLPKQLEYRRVHFSDNLISDIRYQFHIQSLRAIDLKRYFNKKNFVHNIKGRTKREVLENITQLFINNNYLYQSTAQYKYRDIELGNGTVLLQDTYNTFKDPAFFVGFLSSSILWDSQQVYLVVFIKTKKDGDKDLVYLNDLLSKWLENFDEIKRASKDDDYNIFIRNLLRLSSSDELIKELFKNDAD